MTNTPIHLLIYRQSISISLHAQYSTSTPKFNNIIDKQLKRLQNFYTNNRQSEIRISYIIYTNINNNIQVIKNVHKYINKSYFIYMTQKFKNFITPQHPQDSMNSKTNCRKSPLKQFLELPTSDFFFKTSLSEDPL